MPHPEADLIPGIPSDGDSLPNRPRAVSGPNAGTTLRLLTGGSIDPHGLQLDPTVGRLLVVDGQLNGRDILVDIALMKSEREIMTKGQEVPAYMLSGTKGDFTGLPPLHFYYGGDELLSALAESYVGVCKAADVPYTMTVAPGMCHCYAMVPWFPEGRAAYLEIVERLR